MSKLVRLGIVVAILSACKTPGSTTTQTTDKATVEQTNQTWDKSYGGAEKAYDTQLLTIREKTAPKFLALEFKDTITGRTMSYNLFIPKNYDKKKRYPLVQFIADASTVGKGVIAPLKQGYGGIIWATDESQAENPCFVLAPSFSGPDWAVNDKWETSAEVGIAFRLLNSVISDYSIDKKRIYTTGQSMGGMISFYLNANHPHFFAASIFVGSQWDISVLKPLANEKFFYIVSAGDIKASNGMKEVGNLLSENGAKYGAIEFSAKLPQNEQENKVLKLVKLGKSINFIQFTKGTVVPEGYTGKGVPEHMYSFDYAYQLKSVRDWLFKQKN